MKYLRKFTGVLFLFIVAFMITAMLKHQTEQNSVSIIENTAAIEDEVLVIGMAGNNLVDIFSGAV